MDWWTYVGELAQHHGALVYIGLSVRVCAIGVLVSSLELILRPSYLADAGLMSWHISRLDYPWLAGGVFASCLNRLFAYPAILALLFVRVLVAGIQVIGPLNVTLHPALVWIAALLCLAIPLRCRAGLDAADQVAILVF